MTKEPKIIEVNGQQVQVSDDFDSLSPEQKQQVVDEIAAKLKPASEESKESLSVLPNQVSEIYPTIFGAAIGATKGVTAGKAAQTGLDVAEKSLAAKKAELQAAEKAAAETSSKLKSGEAWSKHWRGVETPGVEGVPEAGQKYQLSKPSGKVSEKAYKKFGSQPLSVAEYTAQQEAKAVAKAAEEAAQKAAQEKIIAEAAEAERRASSLKGRVGESLKETGKALFKPSPYRFLGGVLAGGLTGYDAGRAYNQLKAGDYLGAGISGLGALGGALSFIPHPITRIGGTALSVGAAGADYLRQKQKESEEKASGGSIKGYAKGQAVKGGLEALKKFNLGDLEGKTIIGTMSDRTAVDLPRNLRGGPLFPTIHQNAAWAVDAPGAATRLLNAVKAAGGPEKAVVAPMLMSPIAHRSNRDVAKLALKEFQENYGVGKFSPERLTEIETAVRKVPGLEQHPGLLDPNAASMFDKMTFGQRGATVDWLGSKPRKAPAIDLESLLRGTTEKGLEGTELGAIGPSLFKLSGERSIDPSLHGSYSHILHGELLGGMNPIPREFVFRDLESKAMKELGRPLSDYNYRTSVGIPSQFIDEKLLRSWEELGFMKPKTGGVNNPE